MALVVQQSGMTIEGQERDAGYVIPKDVEEKHTWNGHLSAGRVIALPDEMFNGSLQLSKNDVDLSKTVSQVKESVKDIDDIDKIEELMTEEAKGKDRKMVYDALQRRKQDLRD